MNAVLVVAVLLSAFRFNTPDGWTDLTRCPDEAMLAALPPGVQSDARRKCWPLDGGAPEWGDSSAAYAVDLRWLEKENAVATMHAVVLPRAANIDAGTPKVMAAGLVEAAARNGSSLETVDAVAVDVAAQRGAKLRFVRPALGDRMDLYVVPHDGKTAMITFISSNARYEDYEGVFAATAHQSVVPEQLTPGLKILAFVSVCMGALCGYYLMVARRRRRRAT